VLDRLLADAAAESGAELRERFSVEGLVWDGNRVCGITGRPAARGTVAEGSRIVVGADGLHSLVARQVEAPAYNVRPALTCAYYSYWSGVPVDGVEFYPREHRGFGGLPTHDGLTCIIVGWRREEFPAFRADVEGNFLKTLELAVGFAERVRLGNREERFTGTADIPKFYRRPHGPGWALVGDAGYDKDSITAQGIGDAFRDAELADEAVDDGLSGRLALGEGLAAYERRRNQETVPTYDFTCQLAALEPPPPELQQLFGALRGNRADTDLFMGVMAGTTPVPEFFAPENLGRIIGAASARPMGG
jgi:flavin-dependent dehydrogenase